MTCPHHSFCNLRNHQKAFHTISSARQEAHAPQRPMRRARVHDASKLSSTTDGCSCPMPACSLTDRWRAVKISGGRLASLSRTLSKTLLRFSKMLKEECKTVQEVGHDPAASLTLKLAMRGFSVITYELRARSMLRCSNWPFLQ